MGGKATRQVGARFSNSNRRKPRQVRSKETKMKKIAADRNYRMFKEGGAAPMDLEVSMAYTEIRNLFGFGGWNGWELKETNFEKTTPDGIVKGTLLIEKETAEGMKAEMKISYTEKLGENERALYQVPERFR